MSASSSAWRLAVSRWPTARKRARRPPRAPAPTTVAVGPDMLTSLPNGASVEPWTSPSASPSSWRAPSPRSRSTRPRCSSPRTPIPTSTSTPASRSSTRSRHGRPGCSAGELSTLLFVAEGFRGNESDYSDPRNSFLDDVLDRHLGIPITLSVVMLEVGRRCGLQLHGVGMPGHFLVGGGAGRVVRPLPRRRPARPRRAAPSCSRSTTPAPASGRSS